MSFYQTAMQVQRPISLPTPRNGRITSHMTSSTAIAAITSTIAPRLALSTSKRSSKPSKPYTQTRCLLAALGSSTLSLWRARRDGDVANPLLTSHTSKIPMTGTKKFRVQVRREQPFRSTSNDVCQATDRCNVDFQFLSCAPPTDGDAAQLPGTADQQSEL